jgi:hypothetical protein
MNDQPAILPYRYEPGEHRTKHCGCEPHVHFRNDGSSVIGMCPASLSKQEAEYLLQSGILEARPGSDHPTRIYAVHEGVPYEARPTVLGKSYHGFPWIGRPGHNRLPRPIKRELQARAEKTGYLKVFNKWMDLYES